MNVSTYKMPSMTGTFVLIKSDNFDQYMKEVGYSYTMRVLFTTAAPTAQITNEEDQWTIKTITRFNITEIKFKLGQEFDETTEDSRSCRSVITQEGEDKLFQVQKHHEMDSNILREFTDTEMKMTFETATGIVATRTYERVNLCDCIYCFLEFVNNSTYKMPSMTGTFVIIKSENFDEYMIAAGYTILEQNMLRTATPTTKITNEEEEWTITTSTVATTGEIKFKLGQEFDEITLDGRSCKSVITKEGEDKLVHVQQWDDRTVTIVREFTDTEMKMTSKAGDVVATRTYQRQ